MANEGKDEGVNMTERKGSNIPNINRRATLKVLGAFGAAGALNACVPGGPKTVEKVADTLAPTETLPPPQVEVTHNPTVSPVIQEQVVQEIPTATPVPEKPFSCDETNVDSELFKQGYQIGKTVPALSSTEPFGGIVPDGMESQVRSHLSELTEETTIQTVVIPSYLDPNHLQELVKQDTGRDSLPYTIETYYEGIDMKNNTILISPHASVVKDGGGYDLGLWRDGVIGTIGDRYYVKGRLMDWAINSSGEKVLMSVPGQDLYEGEADIALVPNCLPRIVRRQGINKITGILDSNINIIENPGLAWQVNPESEERYIVNNGQVLEATSEGPKVMTLPEGVERVDYVEVHTNLQGETAAYGIEIQNGVDGVAVAKFNGKEWGKFDGPIKLSYPQYNKRFWSEGFEQQISKEYSPSEIKRLVNFKGENVPFGVLDETAYEKDGKVVGTCIKLSGYPVGFYREDKEDHSDFIMFAVPLKYGTQVLSFNIDNDDWWFYKVGLVPDGNIDSEKKRSVRLGHELAEILEQPAALGSQMIIQLDTVPYASKFVEDNNRVGRLFDAIRKGEALEIDANTNLNGRDDLMVFSSSLVPNN